MATNASSELSFDDYRLIAEGSYDWDSWIRPDESLQWTSRAGAAISGYSAAECRAMKRFPWQLVAKDDHVTFELFDHLVGERRPGNDLPVRLVRKDGSVIWVTVSWQPLHDGTGQYQGICLSIRDRSWSLHNRYLDHFRPVAIELLAEIMPAARAGDMQRVYHLMTERAARALGVQRVGIWFFDETGQSLLAVDRFSSVDYLHLEGGSLSLVNCPRYRAALTGDQLIVATDAVHDPVTSELADSYLRPLGIASMLDAPIVRGGRTIGVICHEHVGPMRSWYETELAFVESLSDFVTLALYANEGMQLTERNRMLASIVEALPDPVVTIGLDGNPVYINEAAYQTHEPTDTGLREFKDQHISESYSAAALKFRNEVVVPAALHKGYWRGEVQLKTRQGTEIPVWQTMVAHRDRAGELKFLTSILRDLRDQKAVESRLRDSEAALRTLNLDLEARVVERTRRLEQLNRELEAFFAAIAHDLDEPLLTIDGGARSVLAEIGPKLPEGARNLIQELTDSTLRMRTLIRGLLAHSRHVQRETPPRNP
jgi:PAS domain S-box-containing protein